MKVMFIKEKNLDSLKRGCKVREKRENNLLVRQIFVLSYVFILLVSNVPLSFATFSSVGGVGNGTVENPYNITNWTTLNEVRDDLSANYNLINNISSATTDYPGIGDSWIAVGDPDEMNPFVGTLDGLNNTISDLVISGKIIWV